MYGGFDSRSLLNNLYPIVHHQWVEVDREDELDIQHLSYMTWVEWINFESISWVYMMPTIVAGTFTLNCNYG